MCFIVPFFFIISSHQPAYQNLGTRVEGYVSSFLTDFVWTPEMNKNQLRNSLRRQINE